MTFMKRAAAVLAILGGAAALASGGAGFHFLGPIARIITPSSGSPGKVNGALFLCYDNPALSGVSGQVYTLLGKQVAGMVSNAGSWTVSTGCKAAYATYSETFPGVSGGTMIWDGTSNGNVVHSGVYVYSVQAEGGTYTGTFVVVR